MKQKNRERLGIGTVSYTHLAKPPTFVIFCNDKELFHYSYQRYIENQIRESFGLDGTPIKIIARERGE